MFNLKGVVEFYLSVLYVLYSILQHDNICKNMHAHQRNTLVHTHKQIRQVVNTKVGLPANGVYFVMTKTPHW